MTREEFQQTYLQNLNHQQQEAVFAVDGAVLLLAVPGSGKTTVLVNRLGYMILCRGIAPQKILTMTYTRAATLEMRQRFASLFGEIGGSSLEFCTINSLSSQIIRHYAQWNGKRWPYQVAEGSVTAEIVSNLYQKYNRDFPTESTIRDILTGIAYVKNRMLAAEEIKELDTGIDHFADIYGEYCAVLKQNGLMDFDDQMVYAHSILSRSQPVLAWFQQRFPYICVDESQDTSKIQHEIIKLLAQKHGNLFMVGDEDQSIYGFRAAYPEALLDFETDYPGAKRLLMEQNYRSTKQIIGAANRFISRNRFRHPKTICPTKENGEPVLVVLAENRSAQYGYLLGMAKTCRQETGVLYRNNDTALPLIDLLERGHIGYNLRNFDEMFFSHRIVADLEDMIRFAYDPRDGERFLRIYYKFGTSISKNTALYAWEQSEKSGRSILEELVGAPDLSLAARETAQDLLERMPLIPSGSAENALLTLWKTLKYGSYVASNNLDPGKLEILCMIARNTDSPMGYLERMEALHLLIQNHVNDPAHCLMLSTIHSSKGLEYDSVYLLDVYDGILPTKRGVEAKEEADIREYEEERRIYYVGMTRAKRKLYLFQSPDRDSEFTSEVMSRLPRKAVEEKDVFAAFDTDLRGKCYTHQELGKGRILAQCEEQFLIRFAHHTELLNLAQMAENRKIPERLEFTKAEPETMPKATVPGVKIGSRVTHKIFGAGVIQSIQNGIGAIAFGPEYGMKQIMLASSFEKGILR